MKTNQWIAVLIAVLLAAASSASAFQAYNPDPVVEMQLKAMLKNRYGQDFIVEFYEMDSLINKIQLHATGGYEITDPYNTLQGKIFFTAEPDENNLTNEESKELRTVIGFFRNGQILWDTGPVIRDASGGKIYACEDINNDGKVEILIPFSSHDVEFYTSYLWIIGWDGTAGSIINDTCSYSYGVIEEHGRSVVRSSGELFQFFDYEGDGILEIRGFWDKDDGLMHPDTLMNVRPCVTFSWNGSKYGMWPETPQIPCRQGTRRNLLSASVVCSVFLGEDGTFDYRYTWTNDALSKQKIHEIWFEGLNRDGLSYAPPHWDHVKVRPISGIYWHLDDLYRLEMIKPGQLRGGFGLVKDRLPGIIRFHVQGDAPGLRSDPSEPNLSLQEMSQDIYQNSFHGRTIGPVDLPDPFVPLTFLDTLSSYTTQSRILGWITTQATADKYLGYFASAKTALQANNINAVQSTLNQVLTDVNIDSSSTLSSEAYALLRFNTEYLLAHLRVSGAGFSYSLFASHSMHLQQNSDVYSGDVGVNEAGSSPFLDSQVELSIGISTSIAPGCSVKANRIKVKQGATVAGEVFYNQLENNGTITGTQHSPLTLTLTSGLPEFKPASPGTQDITIAQNGSQALQAGSYGDILVRKNGVLTFTGGTYHLASLNTGDNVQLLFQGPSEVSIAGRFDTDQGTYTGPQDTTSLTASQIVFYIGGINGSNGNLGATPKAAQIGISNTVKANFYVPNGTLWIRQNSKATGGFIGKDVDVGIGVKVHRQSAF